MQTIKVTFNCQVPVDATDTEIEEWIRFELHNNGGMSLKNSLCDQEISARNVQIDYL